jgi:flagellar protein FlbB
MSRIVSNLIRIFVLLLLIAILLVGGLVWFDYLGVINIKPYIAPIYRLFGLQTISTSVGTGAGPFVSDLDDDRLAKRLEALTVRSDELDKREADLSRQETENKQLIGDLEGLKTAQEEREKAFNALVQRYDDRIVNLEAIVANLNGMTPQGAVAIMLALDDQDVIDILRKANEIAQANAATSLVAYWLSLMPADRAAAIQRKMLEKPLATGER